MSSPFQIFRKYQKSLLVVAGVILMFVFVIGDSHAAALLPGLMEAVERKMAVVTATAPGWVLRSVADEGAACSAPGEKKGKKN